MQGLTNKRVAVTGSRKLEEISTMIEKKGGTALHRPIQETVKCPFTEFEEEIRQFAEHGSDWVVLTTGIGTTVLLEAAEHFGVLDEFLHHMKKAKVAARGYKTHQVLKKHDIEPIAVDDDGTNVGLLRALEPFSFTGQNIYIQLHGEPVPILTHFFEEKKAHIQEVLPYKTIVPNPDIVEQLVDEILKREVDAVAFTASPQVRVLFQMAEQKGVLAQLINAFSQEVVAVAVGKVTGSELKERGIKRIVMPEYERMGAMIVALDEYYKNVVKS